MSYLMANCIAEEANLRSIGFKITFPQVPGEGFDDLVFPIKDDFEEFSETFDPEGHIPRFS